MFYNLVKKFLVCLPPFPVKQAHMSQPRAKDQEMGEKAA
jgi:hypothetical protein